MSSEDNKSDVETADRVRAVFEALGITANEAAVKIGEGNSKLYQIVNGKTRPSFVTIQQLIKAYPRINANFILTGKLPILHTNSAEIIGTSLTYVYLPVITHNSLTDMQETYPVLLRDRLSSDLSDCVVVKATDNSMLPRIVPGTVLLAKPVPVVDWSYLNSSLVVVSYRNVLVIRRVKENDLITTGRLTLYSDSESGGYVHIKRDDINSIWRVIEIVGGGIE